MHKHAHAHVCFGHGAPQVGNLLRSLLPAMTEVSDPNVLRNRDVFDPLAQPAKLSVPSIGKVWRGLFADVVWFQRADV